MNLLVKSLKLVSHLIFPESINHFFLLYSFFLFLICFLFFSFFIRVLGNFLDNISDGGK